MPMSKTRQLFLRIFALGEWFALISLVLLTICITADVVGRYIFHAPLHGAVEMGELLMVPMVYVAMANSQHLNLFVRVTMITERLPRRMRLGLDMAADCLGLAFWAFMLWASWDSAMLAWQYDDVTPGLVAIPLFPAKIAVPFGTLLLMIQLCFNIGDSMRGLCGGAHEDGRPA